MLRWYHATARPSQRSRDTHEALHWLRWLAASFAFHRDGNRSMLRSTSSLLARNLRNSRARSPSKILMNAKTRALARRQQNTKANYGIDYSYEHAWNIFLRLLFFFCLGLSKIERFGRAVKKNARAHTHGRKKTESGSKKNSYGGGEPERGEAVSR